jgi:integrase
MASLENRTGYWAISFRFGGKKYNRSLKTADRKAAEELKKTAENTIWKVEQGLLTLPDDSDVIAFFLSGGKANEPVKAPERITLGVLFDEYTRSIEGSVEPSTLDTAGVHTRHLLRILGERLDPRTLKLRDLDKYVEARQSEKTRRGSPVRPTTIKKEIRTLSAIWSWAAGRYPVVPLPDTSKLNYGKVSERPPFQTWEEIEKQIARGGLSEERQAELWDCLFLSLNEISDLLAHVKKNATQPFVYPMVITAAHTGARRSELIRSQINDFQDDTVIVNERKRAKGKYTTRRVPMSPLLQEVITEWIRAHPGGQYTFCLGAIPRSRNHREQPEPLSKNQAHDHLKRTLAGSKWEVLRGWHVLRHSFISNCALKGIDQRIIDSFGGPARVGVLCHSQVDRWS